MFKSVEDLEVESIGLNINSMEIMKIKEVVEESLCLLERKNIQGIKEQKQNPENLIFDDEEQGPGKKVLNSKIVNVKVIEYSSEHNL